MPTTANKGYSVPTPGTEIGTWGADLNANTFTTIDTNLGGVVTVTLSNANVTLTAPQAQNLCVRLIGTLTANVVLTAAYLGMMIIDNVTTGDFNVTLSNGFSATANVPQGQASLYVADAVHGVRTVGQDVPRGSATVWNQTAAPVGWTKSLTRNDMALRVVNGTVGVGGTTAFSTVFAPRYISVANMPAHNHGVNDPGHVHSYSHYNFFTGGAGGTGVWIGDVAANTVSALTGISIQNNGSGAAMDFSVAYVDVILAIRN
jgi:hypothetical protein